MRPTSQLGLIPSNIFSKMIFTTCADKDFFKMQIQLREFSPKQRLKQHNNIQKNEGEMNLLCIRVGDIDLEPNT